MSKDITLSDSLIILATLLGPILAIQAQKVIEAIKRRSDRKEWVFTQLMATRGARISPDHVRALNMIDLAFYGKAQKRTDQEQKVLDTWKEYLDHLNYNGPPQDENSLKQWGERGNELFVNILEAIAKDVGFRFDRVQLKKGGYSPVAHERIENESEALRHTAIDVLAGRTPIKMNVVGFPSDKDTAATYLETIQKLGNALDSNGLKVELQNKTEDK